MIARTSITFQNDRIKKAAESKAKSSGKRTMSAYLEDLVLKDLKKDGISFSDLQKEPGTK